MGTLEKLIAQLCPDGVEYKPLGELGDFFSGMSGVSNKWADQGNCRFIEYMNIYENARIDVARLAFATVKSMNQTSLQKGDVLFTAASEVPEECAIAGEIEDDIGDEVFADDHLFGLRIKPNVGIASGYLKYAFQSPDFRAQVKRYVRGVTRFYIAKQEFVKATIPLPPLPVQKEIVRMLDDMAGLIDALEEELAARKKQYEWCRERLLTFGDDVERKPLGEVCVIKNGRDYKAFGVGPYPVYGSGGIMTYVDHYVYDKPTVLIPRKGSIENIFYVDKPFWNVDTIFYTEIMTDRVIPKYLYYYMLTVDLRRLNNAGGVPSLTQTGLYTLSVALPPLPVQKEIVRMLDDMAGLIDALEEELAARKQQYEYYRDKLLAFKRKPEVA